MTTVLASALANASATKHDGLADGQKSHTKEDVPNLLSEKGLSYNVTVCLTFGTFGSVKFTSTF